MLGLEYREELRKNAELLQEVKDTFDIDNANCAYMLEIVLPVIKVLLYATSHEVRYIKENMEELDCNLEEDSMSSFYTERLGFNNLFKCLRLLAPDCLWAVLERLKSHHTGAIEELKNAILSNDFDRFVSALNKNEINTEPITPISKFLFFQIRLDGLKSGFLELYEEVNASEEEQFPPVIKDKILQLGSDFKGFMQDWSSSQHLGKIGAVYYELFERDMLADDFEQRLYNDDRLFSQEENERNFTKSIKKVYPNFVEDGFKNDEFVINRYKELLSDYCQYIQDSPNLSTYAKIEIERLLKSKYFESIWSRFDEFDNNTAKVLKKEIDEYYKKHGLLEKDAIEAEEQNKETPQTPQMGEEQTSRSPAEVEEQKNAERKKKEAEAFNLIKELMTNTAGEKNFFKDGFTLEHLILFFEKILTNELVLDVLTKTNNKTKFVYKGIVIEKFCNIIGYLIHKGVIIYPQKKTAEALFGMEETKTVILNWKPLDKNSQEAFDREQNLFPTCCSYISNGSNDTSKSFIDSKIRKWFDETLDSIRQPQ